MCNVDEDDGPIKLQRGTQSKKCVKCDNPGVLVTRVNDAFCKECFRVYVVHKFRSAIGKSKLIRDGEHVLVAFSGGLNSSALLHLITDGLSVRAHKRLRFVPSLLYVDEHTILEGVETSRLKLQQQISELMLQSGFPSYVTSLEEGLSVFSDHNHLQKTNTTDDLNCWEASSDISSLKQPSEESVLKLKTLFSNLSSLTAKEEFLRNYRNQLIISLAKKLGVGKVLLAECSTRLSVRILSDIAQGRGSQVSSDAGFSDSRDTDVMIIRPIRDLTAKEVGMYSALFNVNCAVLPTLTTKAVTGASIEHLTESFVTGLQANFSSTTSNIIRTSEKLSQSKEENVDKKCIFCKSTLDTDVGVASALNAKLFSKQLSKSGRKCEDTGSGDGVVSSTDGLNHHLSSTDNDVNDDNDFNNSRLCFGCQLVTQDYTGELSDLPFYKCQQKDGTSTRTNLTQNMDSLREKIDEFLL